MQNSVRSWQYSDKTFVWEEMEKYVKKVDAVMLSHGHWDHAGGLTKAFDLIVKAKGLHLMMLVMMINQERNHCLLNIDIDIQGDFFHWYPPKKYGKSRLGESTLT